MLDDLVDVVLIHELAHLVTHRGFGMIGTMELSDHFMEYAAQCATYAYLITGHSNPLKVFEDLSEHQPFNYRTWESFKELPTLKRKIKSRPHEAQEVVKALFKTVLHTLRPAERDETIDIDGIDD